MAQLNGFVEKGWGHENIFATNDKYTGKLLVFNEGSRFSMHGLFLMVYLIYLQ